MAFMFVIGLITETNKHISFWDDVQMFLTNWYIVLFLCGLFINIVFGCRFKYHYGGDLTCIN